MQHNHVAKYCSALLCVLVLQACTRINEVTEVEDGAGEAIDASLVPDAIPRIEPITKAGNTSPYTVPGYGTYQVLPTAKNYKKTGLASWYGTKFHGRKTANGEIYDMYAMTGAHRSLPIPAYAKVTNMQNNKSVVVRINDRGPFHEDRIIDLSYVAALKLGFANQGTARVEVVAISPEPAIKSMSNESVAKEIKRDSIDSSSSRDLSKLPRGGVFLQIGAFAERTGAKLVKEKIQPLTSLPIEIIKHQEFFKVKIGPIRNSTRLKMLRNNIRNQYNISPFILWP